MRVLWFCNRELADEDGGGTGTWLDAMARALMASREVQLGNITQGRTREFARRDWGELTQWIAPCAPTVGRTGLPTQHNVREIASAVESFQPDLLHIWGTESYWGLLTARRLLKTPALLEMQGLKSAIAPVYAGGLTPREQFACIGFKEVVTASPIWRRKARFTRWTRFEEEIIRGHRLITVQSDWLESRVKALNPLATVARNEFLLRQSFHRADHWDVPQGARVFCSAAYPSPFKGIHTAIRAIALLSGRHADIQLRIGGALQRSGLRQDGYIGWLGREAQRLKIHDRIVWLGPLSADEIVAEMHAANTVLLPTHVEGYCLALAEAMHVGVPPVVSFVGGTSYLARDGESALFFPPGDAPMCAYQLDRLLSDRDLALKLSRNARHLSRERNDPDRVLRRQLAIYRQCVSPESGL